MTSYSIPSSIIAMGARKYNLPSQKKRLLSRMLAALSGVFLGAVNGIFGAGGGMLAVPVLTYVLGFDDKTAHATAIAVILPLCLLSVVAYSLRASFDMAVVIPTAVGVFAGGIIGAILLKKIPTEWLGFLFYGLMLLAGIKMLV